MKPLRWLLTLPWRIARFPFRLYRRKISVQLIVSHVMVVMLSIVLLIDDLFTVARIEKTTLPLEMTVLRLNEVATDIGDGIREIAWEQSKISVESLVPATLPPVLADSTRPRQILGNLLYNALRRTPEGGLIVVNAERIGTMLRVSVSDTGVGISP